MHFFLRLLTKNQLISRIWPAGTLLFPFLNPGRHVEAYSSSKVLPHLLTAGLHKTRGLSSIILSGSCFSKKKRRTGLASFSLGFVIREQSKMEEVVKELSSEELLPPDALPEEKVQPAFGAEDEDLAEGEAKDLVAEEELDSSESTLIHEDSKVFLKDLRRKQTEALIKETHANETFSKLPESSIRTAASSSCESKSSKGSERPNYFLSIQITDAQILRNIQEIQQHVIAHEPGLASAAINPASLHLTLVVFRCTSDVEINAVMDAMEEGFPPSLRHPLLLKFTGLDHFRNKVLFAKLTEGKESIQKIFDSLLKSFGLHGIPLPKTRPNLTPHLTIFKTYRSSKHRKKGITKIDSKLYEKYAELELGNQFARSLQLCSMTGPKDQQGYYQCLLELPFNNPQEFHLRKTKQEVRSEISSLFSANFPKTT